MDAGVTSPRVLVVDDDSDVLASLERGLRLSGFEVSTAVDGAEALRSATETRPDAIVLDINMPVLDGVSVVTALRAMDNDVPVCVLSARSSVDDRVAGLEAGADDYLVKPFAVQELIARLRALTRRGGEGLGGGGLRSYGDLSLDAAARRATRAGRVIELTGRETALLELLLRETGRVVTRERAIEQIWDDAAEANVVDRYVTRLRRKLGAPPLIRTVRGSGFTLRG